MFTSLHMRRAIAGAVFASLPLTLGCSSEDTPANNSGNSPTCLFCDDFEGHAEGAVTETSTFTPVTSAGTLNIDAVHARGSKALHVHTEGNGRAYIQLKNFTPPNNSFFGRMYVWVDAFPTAPNYAHYTLVEAAGAEPDMVRPIGGQYIAEEGKNMWGPGADGGKTGDWTNWKASAPAESGKWLCMEWEMADADSAIRVWIDGQEKTDLAVSKTQHGGVQFDFVFPKFDKLWLGWWLYQAGPTPDHFDVWFDDIAITSQRKGCQ